MEEEEAEYMEEDDAEYMEDDYIGAGDYYEGDDYHEEDDYSNTNGFEYSGENESDVAFSTSYGDDSECSSGYDESSS